MDLGIQADKYIEGEYYIFTVDSVDGMKCKGYYEDEFGDINVPAKFVPEMRQFCGNTYNFRCVSNKHAIRFIIDKIPFSFSLEMFVTRKNVAILMNL